MREKHSVWVYGSGSWQRALILGTVLALTVSLATRYSTVRGEAGTTKNASSQSLDSKRQHLLNDGLHWTAPAATFVLFEPAEVSSAVWPVALPTARPYAEDLLYSRPPPCLASLEH